MKDFKSRAQAPINLSQAILYGIGCGIGGSIFILLATGINVAGPGVLISLILGGFLIFLTALNYSELSTSLPISGGAYNFSKEGLGGFSAFIIGFFLWIANVASCTFSALAFAAVFQIMFPFLFFIDIPLAIIMIIFMSVIVFRSEKIAFRTLIFLTIILIAIFGMFIISGLFISPFTNDSGYDPTYLNSGFNILGVFQMFALLFIFFTSITSNLAYVNADLKNPSKNIPKVNILAIFITLGIYLSVSCVTLINVKNISTDSPVLLADVLGKILGPIGFYLMAFASLISTFISMNASLGSAVSVLHALARDNYVPKKLKVLSEKTNVPVYCLLVSSFIAALFTIFANLAFAAEVTSSIYFIGLAFVNFAAVRLRYRRKELARPFKAPFFPYLPITVGVFCLILSFALEPLAVLFGLIILAIGLTYYLLKIADRYSKVLILAGMKCFGIIFMSASILAINNLAGISSKILGFEEIFKYLLLRILIFIGIFTMATIILDLFPLKQFIYFFVKRMDKEKVAINVGTAQIIDLEQKEKKAIYKVENFIGITQILSGVFVIFMVYLFFVDIISITNISVGTATIPEATVEYLFSSILSFLAICLEFSGIYCLYRNYELKSLGI